VSCTKSAHLKIDSLLNENTQQNKEYWKGSKGVLSMILRVAPRVADIYYNDVYLIDTKLSNNK
jgi:hypothetical protein